GRVRFRLPGVSACFVAERSMVRVEDRERFHKILQLEESVSDVRKQIELLAENQTSVLMHIQKQRETLMADSIGVAQIDANIAQFQKDMSRVLAERELILETCRARLTELVHADETGEK